mmetsp:Transcript_23162/g.54954  ORF Transcript_23162/g.54954 Transcript_23162/m.54954 type:complete len:211 (-) Transcript_23162:85-717(-)
MAAAPCAAVTATSTVAASPSAESARIEAGTAATMVTVEASMPVLLADSTALGSSSAVVLTLSLTLTALTAVSEPLSVRSFLKRLLKNMPILAKNILTSSIALRNTATTPCQNAASATTAFLATSINGDCVVLTETSLCSSDSDSPPEATLRGSTPFPRLNTGVSKTLVRTERALLRVASGAFIPGPIWKASAVHRAPTTIRVTALVFIIP